MGQKTLKLKKFSLYKIAFYDHFIGGVEEVICETVGFFLSEDVNYMNITTWLVITKDKELRESNYEPTALVKACIISITKLD